MIVGNISELGLWNIADAFLLSTDISRYPEWTNQKALVVTKGKSYLKYFRYQTGIQASDCKWGLGLVGIPSTKQKVQNKILQGCSEGSME